MTTTLNKAAKIREYKKEHPRAKPKDISIALSTTDTTYNSHYISDVLKKSKKKPTNKKSTPRVTYPRHSLEKSLRIPRVLLEQNAGKKTTDNEAATFCGLKSPSGPFSVEISSSIKFGLLERLEPGTIEVSKRCRRILRPQSPEDELLAIRESVQDAPGISDVYNHFRGENIPDDNFFNNTLVDLFTIPKKNLDGFKEVFFDTLKKAKLIENHNSKQRVVDFSKDGESGVNSDQRIKTLGKGIEVDTNDTCFVMMPFADPHGGYYSLIYEPAINKTGLKPVRADNDIFGTGKIMNQVWMGIKAAKVLVAELTTKNPNVFYELGLAHALKKPVVLVSSNEEDVPFDLQHIRVIYYDTNDPFWGNKLLDKVAENILSAIRNPEEATFEGEDR